MILQDPEQYINILDLSLFIDYKKFFIKSYRILYNKKQNFYPRSDILENFSNFTCLVQCG